LTDAGNDLVATVPMPATIIETIDGFIASITSSGPSTGGNGTEVISRCPATAARTRGTTNDPVRKHHVALVADEARNRQGHRTRRFIPRTQTDRRRFCRFESNGCDAGSRLSNLSELRSSSLPPLQSITAGTDIRSFLGSSVPVELTKAALRRAWVTDPAIRDFIGIAESQWISTTQPQCRALDR